MRNRFIHSLKIHAQSRTFQSDFRRLIDEDGFEITAQNLLVGPAPDSYRDDSGALQKLQ